VVHVNVGSAFLMAEAEAWWKTEDAATRAYLEANGFERDRDAATAFRKRYLAERPFPFADIGDVAYHYDHVVSLAGIDHVGIGSYFDGVGDTLPIGLKSVADDPNLIEERLRRGYADAQLEMQLGLNLMRVWNSVEARATR
jgi:membrane dipeptidase